MNILPTLRLPCLTFGCDLAVIWLQKPETSAAGPGVVRRTTVQGVRARGAA